jgi:hypothetical protein
VGGEGSYTERLFRLVYYSGDAVGYQQKKENMEKKIMKRARSNSLKVLLVMALLCPAAFADGEMGSGGLADYDTPPATVKTSQSLEDGEMGSGGKLSEGEDGISIDSVLSSIYEYLDSMI